MRAFSYDRALDQETALNALGDAGTVALAGGTELLNWMRLGIAAPDRVIDIGQLPGLDQIVEDGAWLRVGALSTLSQVERHDRVREHAVALAQASLKAASAQVRNRATLGGNVLQRTRCPYFRAEDPMPWACNKREAGSGCAARHGITSQAAIFDWTDECVATQPSDPAVALACLEAEYELVGPRGLRRVPAQAFHRSQDEAGSARDEVDLASDELIIGCRIPLTPALRSAYVKVRERESYAYALVSAAAAVATEDAQFSQVRIALGSVAQRPWRLYEAESRLVGQPARADVVRDEVTRCMRDARPLAGNGYKVAMATGAAVRAVMTARGTALG